MNARLYDPVLGRFLSPDPYVQAPDFSQSFNRYAYALNNPLKYTDRSGAFLGTYFTALFQWPIALIKGVYVPLFVSNYDTAKANKISRDAWKEFGNKVSNAFKLDLGLFKTDETLNNKDRAISLLSRFTWELPQTIMGNCISHYRNNLTSINIEYYNGATLVNRNGKDFFDGTISHWGMTLGAYVLSLNVKADPETDRIFAHEYGHVLQSKKLGLSYLPLVGPPSIVGSAISNVSWLNHDHHNEWYEVWANNLANDYYHERSMTNASSFFGSGSSAIYPLDFYPDLYFLATVTYYIWLMQL